jgi:hypothetical protein
VEQGAAGKRQALRTDRDEAEPARRRIDRLLRDVRRRVEHHLIGNEPRFAAGRDAGESGLSRKWPVRKSVAREAGRKSAIAKPARDTAVTKASRDTAVAEASREAATAKAAIRGATRQAGGIAGQPTFTALGSIRPARNDVLLVDTVLRRSRLALRAARSMREGMLWFGCMLERVLRRSGHARRTGFTLRPKLGANGLAAAGRWGAGAGALRRSNACPSPAMLRQTRMVDATRPRFAASRLQLRRRMRSDMEPPFSMSSE